MSGYHDVERILKEESPKAYRVVRLWYGVSPEEIEEILGDLYMLEYRLLTVVPADNNYLLYIFYLK